MKNGMLLFFSLLLLSCTDKKTQPERIAVEENDTIAIQSVNRLAILPGERIGNTAIEQNATELDSLLGTPDLSDAAMGKAWLTWYSKISDSVSGKYELNIYTTYKDNEMKEKVVRQIRITSPEFKTSDGLSTGQSLGEITKVYPKLEREGTYTNPKTNNIVQLYDAADSGIAFETENDTCIAIIIHRKGKNVTNEYLYFHPEMIRQ